jgi:hypothetical protein
MAAAGNTSTPPASTKGHGRVGQSRRRVRGAVGAGTAPVAPLVVTYLVTTGPSTRARGLPKLDSDQPARTLACRFGASQDELLY